MQIKRTVTTTKEFAGIGARIKNARLKDGRKLTEICRECGITRAYWYQIENESLETAVSEYAIRKIELVLGIDLNLNFEE